MLVVAIGLEKDSMKPCKRNGYGGEGHIGGGSVVILVVKEAASVVVVFVIDT